MHGQYSEAGSVLVQDSIFSNVPRGIVTHVPTEQRSRHNNTNLALDNVVFSGVDAAVVDHAGTVHLKGSDGPIDTWARGALYFETNRRDYTIYRKFATDRPSGLTMRANSGGYVKPFFFERKRPQYENVPASGFVSVKAKGAKGMCRHS